MDQMDHGLLPYQLMQPEWDRAPARPDPGKLEAELTGIVRPALSSGLTFAQIAELLRERWPDVPWDATRVERMSRALLPDTRSQAKRLIDAEALAITADVIDNGQPKDKLMLLRGRGVLDEPASTGVTIIIGGQDVTVNLGIAVVNRDG